MIIQSFQRTAIRPRVLSLALLGAFWFTAPTTAWAEPQLPEVPFDQWLQAFEAEAVAKGVDADLAKRALSGVEPVPRVIELDRHQPEFTQTFWDYLDKRVTPGRIERGRKLLQEHADLLDEVEQKYGVQPRFLVAFWGLESNFGDYTGVFPLTGALATLAHDARRAEFFRAELLAALKIMQRGDVPLDAKASWAGALGQTQFIPTTHLAFAVDFDGDNKRDLWNSLGDIFASSANYLAKSGWQGDQTWGREVRLPDGFDLELSGLGTRKTLAEWQAVGVRRINGGNLPKVDIEGSVMLPAGVNGPAFLVYRNFRTIMIWNRSVLYAVAVGHLADRLIQLPPLKSVRHKEVAMSRDDVMELQRRLTQLGFDTDGVDGVVGPNTRKQVKAFQRSVHLPPDGYPSFGLLERLRAK